MEGLRHRLLRWLLLPLTIAFIAGVAANYVLALKPAEDAFDYALTNTAAAIAALIQREEGRPVLRLQPRTEAVLRTDRVDRIYFALFTADGQRIDGDAELPFAGRHEGIRFHDVQTAAGALRLASMAHRFDDDLLIIEVAETLGKRERLWRTVLYGFSGPNLAMVLITLFLVSYGIAVGLRPLERLRAHVASRSPRDLAPLPLEQVPEELRPLIEALNRQFALLAESLSSQERFLSDAAHQLKTPLAALYSQLELAAGDPDPESRQRRLAEMMQATRRVSHLAHQLLALARAEPSAGMQAQRQRVRLADVAESVAASHVDRAIARDIDLGFELAEAEVEGIPWLLRELLANLVDNALTYAPPGSNVTVRCGRRDGDAFLEVEDDGPGIAPAERERIFERFYRPPGSEGDGCGLGLAIVREIAAGHGARLSLRDAATGGTVFTVVFRGAAAAA